MTILPSPQQLRYLVSLAESRHFGRAAQACAVTQSTLPAGLVALPPNHRLAGEEQISVTALATERLLLLEDGHCLRDQALAVCGLLAGERGEEDGFAATSLHTLVQMVAGGLGVTLLPKLAVAA